MYAIRSYYDPQDLPVSELTLPVRKPKNVLVTRKLFLISKASWGSKVRKNESMDKKIFFRPVLGRTSLFLINKKGMTGAKNMAEAASS